MRTDETKTETLERYHSALAQLATLLYAHPGGVFCAYSNRIPRVLAGGRFEDAIEGGFPAPDDKCEPEVRAAPGRAPAEQYAPTSLPLLDQIAAADKAAQCLMQAAKDFTAHVECLPPPLRAPAEQYALHRLRRAAGVAI
jgi:hypothetical protein